MHLASQRLQEKHRNDTKVSQSSSQLDIRCHFKASISHQKINMQGSKYPYIYEYYLAGKNVFTFLILTKEISGNYMQLYSEFQKKPIPYLSNSLLILLF